MIGVFSISPLNDNCLLEKTFPKQNGMELHVTYNNRTVGLCEFYNKIIDDKSNDRFDAIVLCHHDVSLRFANLEIAARDALLNFDIVGVAGGINPKIVDKNLWHWMMSKEEYRGIAAHGSRLEEMYVTSFGLTPASVDVLDGVFLMLNPSRIRNTKARFDNKFMWHHYDIDFSLTCRKYNLKLGVWPVLIYHQSPGLRDINDNSWNKSNEYFKQKWK